MNKDMVEIINVEADTQEIYDALPVIAEGEVWKIKSFGACDINIGDHKSSFYLLKWGNVNVCPISLTGNTIEIPIDRDFTGDSVKKFTIVYKNNSSSAKNLAFWIRATKRN